MTAPKPGAKRGRPAKEFRRDPDLSAVAIAMALQTFGLSERSAFLLLSTLVLGRKIGERAAPARRKRGVGQIGAGVLATYERVSRVAETSASILNYARNLKRKAHRAHPEAAAWLAQAAAVIAAYLHSSVAAGDDFQGVVTRTVDFAKRATAAAAQKSALPDYLSQVSAPTLAYDLQHQREEMPMMPARRDLYASLSKPMFADGMATMDGSRPATISVLIAEADIARLITMTPGEPAVSARALANQLARMIADLLETRAA
jgi:hypothetical protein